MENPRLKIEYLLMPRVLERCETGTSFTRKPSMRSKEGRKRCMPLKSLMDWKQFARNTLSEHPVS